MTTVRELLDQQIRDAETRLALLRTERQALDATGEEAPLPHGLPAGVRYDGPALFPSSTLLLFTELVTGSSFAVPAPEASGTRIAAEAVEMRRRFHYAASNAGLSPAAV